MKKCLLLLILFLFSFPVAASPFTVPQLRGYVNDYGNLISPSMEADLTSKLKSFEASDSTQLVVLTVPSLEGEPIEDYGIKVAEAWKIGQKGKDNGILFIVSRQERKMRVEVGRGLEGRLTDLMAGRIVDLVVKPIFQQGNYDEGFRVGVDALIGATRGEFRAKPSSARGRSSGGSLPLVFIFSIIIIASMLIRNIFRGGRRRGSHSGWFLGGGGLGGGGWSSGGGGYSGSGSGGGFSGGGGGSFGGGGASGSW